MTHMCCRSVGNPESEGVREVTPPSHRAPSGFLPRSHRTWPQKSRSWPPESSSIFTRRAPCSRSIPAADQVSLISFVLHNVLLSDVWKQPERFGLDELSLNIVFTSLHWSRCPCRINLWENANLTVESWVRVSPTCPSQDCRTMS